jgi:hypothetical protein
MNGLGGKVLDAIQLNQQLVVQDPKVVQQPVFDKARKDRQKHPIEGARRQRIEQLVHLIGFMPASGYRSFPPVGPY